MTRPEPDEPADLADLRDLALDLSELLELARRARDVADAEELAIKLEQLAADYQRVVDSEPVDSEPENRDANGVSNWFRR